MPADLCVVPISAFEDSRLSVMALRVFGLLCSYADGNGVCSPSQSALAKRLGISRPTVNYHIKILCGLGYLKAERRSSENGGEVNCEYRIATPPVDGLVDAPVDAGSTPPVDGLVDTPVDVGSTPPVDGLIETPVDTGSTPPVDGLIDTPVNAGSTPPVDGLIDTPVNAGSTPPVDGLIDTPVDAGSTPPVDGLIDTPVDAGSTPPVDGLIDTPVNTGSTPPVINNPGVDSRNLLTEIKREEEEREEASSTSSEESSTHDNHDEHDAQGDQGLLPGNHTWMGIYPETITEAQQNRHIQVYKRVTGKMPLVGNYKMVVDAIMQLRETYPSDDDLVEYLTPLWKRWKESKRKDGRSYSQNNPAWLTEWAMDGLNEDEEDEPVSTRGVSVIKNPTPAQRARAMPTALPEPPRRS